MQDSIRKPLSTAVMMVLAGGTSATAQAVSAVTMNNTGNTTVAWQNTTAADGSLGGIFARQMATFPVNTTTAGNQIDPAMAMAASGAFVVVWQGADQSGSGIFAQRYNADGSVAGTEFQINPISSGEQRNPAVAMTADGGFIVAWEDNVNGGFAVTARRYQADGTALDNGFTVAAGAGDQLSPAIAVSATGEFAITWQDANGIQLQRFAADGTAGAATTVAAQPAATVQVAGGVNAMAGGFATDLAISNIKSNLNGTNTAITYTITVKNVGTTSATNFTLANTLPGSVAFTSATNTGGWSCPTPGGTVVNCSYTGAAIAPNSTTTVTISMDILGSPAALVNSATVTIAGDGDPTDNTASKTDINSNPSGSAGGGGGGGGGGGAMGWLTLAMGLLGLRRRWYS